MVVLYDENGDVAGDVEYKETIEKKIENLNSKIKEFQEQI